VQHSDGSDAELVERARAGSAPAFAVLLHRHGAAVRAVVAGDRDPTGAVIGTFVTAMRRLPAHPVDDTPRDWLLQLAASEVRKPQTADAQPMPDLEPDELDEIWAELDLRWPDGRVPRTVPRWVGWSALVITLAALAILVPYTVLTLGGNGDDGPNELASLVARPFEDPDAEDPDTEAPVDEASDEDLEPPPFVFPDMEPESAPADTSETDPAPESGPDPAAPEPPPSEPTDGSDGDTDQ
jgi:hypothetical protein